MFLKNYKVGKWKYSVQMPSTTSTNKQNIVVVATSKTSKNAMTDPMQRPINLDIIVDETIIGFPNPVRHSCIKV